MGEEEDLEEMEEEAEATQEAEEGSGTETDVEGDAFEGLEFQDEIDPGLATLPPSGSGGFEYYGTGHIRNETKNLCAQRFDNVLANRPCSTHPDQVFAAYRQPDGGYYLCLPEALRRQTVSNCGGSWVAV